MCRDRETGDISVMCDSAWVNGGYVTRGVSGQRERIAAVSATAMLMMMYLAAFDNSNNPLTDDHIIHSLAVLGISRVEVERQSIGLGTWWKKLSVVQSNRWLI